MCGLSRWNSIFRMTLVTLGSPGLRAGKSPDFLVLRGLARSGRSRVKVPGARILSRNVANARSACSGEKAATVSVAAARACGKLTCPGGRAAAAPIPMILQIAW